MTVFYILRLMQTSPPPFFSPLLVSFYFFRFPGKLKVLAGLYKGFPPRFTPV